MKSWCIEPKGPAVLRASLVPSCYFRLTSAASFGAVRLCPLASLLEMLVHSAVEGISTTDDFQREREEERQFRKIGNVGAETKGSSKGRSTLGSRAAGQTPRPMMESKKLTDEGEFVSAGGVFSDSQGRSYSWVCQNVETGQILIGQARTLPGARSAAVKAARGLGLQFTKVVVEGPKGGISVYIRCVKAAGMRWKSLSRNRPLSADPA
jgi:hypothetical protein